MDLDTRILIVDDFTTMRLIAKRILQSLGFNNIAEAEDGLEALDTLKNNRFDLVLSDCNMPNMNGIELLTRLRNDPELNTIPFIVMTSTDQKESLLEMVKAGASDYIEKPFQAEDLRKKLEKFVD
jgi:two-component system chemotaxis response regulator CheY